METEIDETIHTLQQLVQRLEKKKRTISTFESRVGTVFGHYDWDTYYPNGHYAIIFTSSYTRWYHYNTDWEHLSVVEDVTRVPPARIRLPYGVTLHYLMERDIREKLRGLALVDYELVGCDFHWRTKEFLSIQKYKWQR